MCNFLSNIITAAGAVDREFVSVPFSPSLPSVGPYGPPMGPPMGVHGPHGRRMGAMGVPWNAMGAPWAAPWAPICAAWASTGPKAFGIVCSACTEPLLLLSPFWKCTFYVHETLTFVENERLVYTKPLLFRVFNLHSVLKGSEG